MLKHFKSKTKEYYIDENGNIHGEYKAYHKNGQIYIICNYVNGEIQGEYKEYYENGKPNIICNYINNKMHGEYKQYYSDGKIYIICNYVNGEIQGEYKSYHVNGELFEHIFCHMGKRVDLSIHGMDIDNLSQNDINLLTVIYA